MKRNVLRHNLEKKAACKQIQAAFLIRVRIIYFLFKFFFQGFDPFFYSFTG